jgi:hypothetical protein
MTLYLKKFFHIKNLKLISQFIPKFIKKKIRKKFFPFYFLFSNLKQLPYLSYVNNNHYEIQEELISNFKKDQKQSSFMTCPYLHELLLMKYKSDESFDFLDIGGEYIDFFLHLKKNFKNVNYYLFNIEKINNNFKKIKKKYFFKNLNVISDQNFIYRNKFDFINLGSSIQYFNNYEIVLEITKISNNIFFSGTTLFESNNENYYKHIITEQINCLPDINYCYFFNKKYFYNFFYKEGFELLFSKKNLTDNVNFKNFEKIFEKIEYTDFFFIKKNL